jgi:Tfp pilus assembly protein PilN
VLCLVLFVIVMAGVVWAAWAGRNKATALRLANEEVCQEYRQAAKSITQIRQLEARKEQVIAKARTAAELLERVPRSYVLACVTNGLPEGASLAKVQLRTTVAMAPKASQSKAKFSARTSRRRKREEPTEPEITRPKLTVGIEITGLARTDVEVAQFISNMQSNPLLSSVELVYSAEEEVHEEVLRKFQVTMQLADNAEVEADTTQTASTMSPAPPAALGRVR